jgi:uncharacterized Zn finger protein
MGKKKYRIKTSCPQCGCGGEAEMSEEELKEKYGDVPNIHLECHECMMIMDADVTEADGKPES